jgi:hypothetical protein
MDKVSRYRTLIKQLLTGLADLSKGQPDDGVETVCAFDETRDQYLLLNVGWQGNRRQRGMPLYLRIRGGKIWVEEDWTEEGIANALLRAGVPKQDIVLGFHAPHMRELTEFAVA